MKSALRFFSISTFLLLTGCAGLSSEQLFSTYSNTMQTTRTDLAAGQFANASVQLKPLPANHNSYVLNLLERAKLAQLAGDHLTSQTLLTDALTTIDEQNFDAQVQLSRGVENVTAFLTNDNARSYRVPYYEQTLAHTYQVFNYLAAKQFDSAMVEIRKANLVQETALKQNQKFIEQAARKQNIDLGTVNGSYPTMDALIGNVKNGFQNAYTFYLSAVLYEAAGQIDDAYIDYKRAIDIYPNNPYLQKELLRIAKHYGFSEEYAAFKKRFTTQAPVHSNNLARVVVLIEQDLIPVRQSHRMDLPIYTSRGDMRFYSIATPTYTNLAVTPVNNTLSINNLNLVSSEIVNMAALAAKDLKDNIAGSVVRQVARVAAKEEMRRAIAKEGGEIGNILATLYNIASEQADTRSWQTLPSNVQVISSHFAPGEYQAMLENTPLTLSLSAGKTTLVHVTQVNGHISYQTYTL